MIDGSELDERVKELSKKVFKEIAIAEGKIHNVPLSEVSFHEVGAIDSIIDIVGVCVCIWMLGIDRVYSSELRDGKGFVETMHGRLPVPVPAVLEMLAGSGIPVIQEDINFELVTPTGIGLAKVLAESFGPMHAARIERVGYGFGKRDTGRLNALRVVLGEQIADGVIGENAGEEGVDHIVALEANIDDMTAEALGFAMERLFSAGALDVFFTPIYMKKNRPATMLTVLSKPGDSAALTDVVFRETTTLGVRESYYIRSVMGRKIVSVELGQNVKIKCKVARRKDVVRVTPEYDDCRAYAIKSGIPLSEVFELARGKAGT